MGFVTCGVLALSGCAQPPPTSNQAPAVALSLGEFETDAAGRCFATGDAPTRTEIVSELVEVTPVVKDRNGVVQSPAVFRTVTRPVSMPTGQGDRFEAVCPHFLTSSFVASLQRALIVRRAYGGPVSGSYDLATRDAIRTFQARMGIASDLLSVAVARDLGLVSAFR